LIRTISNRKLRKLGKQQKKGSTKRLKIKQMMLNRIKVRRKN